jgi:multidrug efflux system outer membrane protein
MKTLCPVSFVTVSISQICRSVIPRALLLLAILLCASCAVGPDYEAPDVKLEASFKNAGFQDAPPVGSWWAPFNDPELARLIRAAGQDGPSVRAALARYDQARAGLGLARVDQFPAVTGAAYARRQSDSGNANFSSGIYNDYRSALNLSWEIDLWGRVRRQVGVADAELKASGFEYQATLLSLRGEVARAYLSLRFADAEIDLLERTAGFRKEAQRLMKARFDGGASSSIDYARAVTEYESVIAELEQLRAQRGRFENALATLTGRSASGFRVAATGGLPRIPSAPPAVPSDLLRRRPDLAAAERRLAAASERIGLVVASYLPRLSITGEGGLQSLHSSDLFNSDSKLWSLGPELDLPFYQGGRAFFDKDAAEAAYREALENYREVLLRAVEEVENALSDGEHLAKAARARKRGSASAEHVASLTRKRYLGGVTDYFEVVDAERTTLAEQRATLAVDLARALAATALIEGLGGGWQR